MDSESSTDKSFEPTPKKLEDARKRGEVVKSNDILTAAAYFGFFSTFLLVFPTFISEFGSNLTFLLRNSGILFLQDGGLGVDVPLIRSLFLAVLLSLVPLFIIPAAFVVISLFGQRAIVFAPSKLKLKLSRVSLIQNAKQKFGVAGLFEFFKSFLKLAIYSTILGAFLSIYLDEMVATTGFDARISLTYLGDLLTYFFMVVLSVSFGIAALDYVFQYFEHRRKNRMSRKEVMDEMKESEGDPYLKQERKARAQTIATSQMMQEVPTADVLVVNPTHYAVALKWSREPGTAPICVAKGVDAVATVMREVAQEHAVPIHSDPPTARALHATVDVGAEVHPEHYQAVAAAIRFADKMRKQASGIA
jgi:flagellar biosynthetic protein FlhB